MRIEIVCTKHNQPVVGEVHFGFTGRAYEIDTSELNDREPTNERECEWIGKIYDLDGHWIGEVDL